MSADITLDPSVAAAAIQTRADLPAAANVTSAAASATGGLSPLLPNPRLTVDPGSSHVVLEFYNSSGTLTNTIPSQKQLDAYRLAALSGQSTSAVQG